MLFYLALRTCFQKEYASKSAVQLNDIKAFEFPL